jgi:hypothetical protein
MNLQERKALLERLGDYMKSDEPAWQAARHRAFAENAWFIPQFTDIAVKNIATNFLDPDVLGDLISRYQVPPDLAAPKNVGIVMAGNIPLVGFHDLLCVFLYGHRAMVKPSSKDTVLVTHLVNKMTEWNPSTSEHITISEMIRNCDAYIATGSNNSSRYFEYYFQKYPSIIRRNRTSVAVLTGKESESDLQNLADDVHLFFGLGCRNVTKISVPVGYDFIPMLQAFRKYSFLVDNNKYKNNYDYNLAMHILNNTYYMTNGSILLIEDKSLFSRIGQLHYEFYTDEKEIEKELAGNEDIQCVVKSSGIDFGKAQQPGICDFADGIDTMAFLRSL